MGSDIKQRIIESVRSTWQTLNRFALAHRTPDARAADAIEEEVDCALDEMRAQEEQRDIDAECAFDAICLHCDVT